MAPLQVKNAILHAFEELHLESFVVLETTESGHCLIKAEEQNIDVEWAIKKRGCIYLCENYEHTVTLSSGSDSDDSDIIRTTYNTSKQLGTSDEKMSDLISKSDRLLKELKAPVPVSSDESEPESPQPSSSEWRRIHIEQDQAYAESLHLDQLKQAEKQRREEFLATLRLKWTEEKLHSASGMKFCLRFPSSRKLECTLSNYASTLVG